MRSKIVKVLGLLGVAVLALTLNASAQTKEDAAKLYNDGVAAYNTKNYPVAITNFNQAIDIAGKVGDEANDIRDGIVKLLPSCHYQVAMACYKDKKFVEAIAEFNETIEVANKYNDKSMANKAATAVPQLYRLMGNQEFSAKNYEKAKSYYNMGLRLNPDATSSLLGLGLVYDKQNKPDSAIVYYDKMIEVGTRTGKPDDVMKAKSQARDLYLEKASAAEKARRYEDAITAYQTGFKYAPENDAVYYKMAFASYSLSKWDDAIASANMSLSLVTNPDDKAKVYFLMANIYSKKNDTPNACANYKLSSASPKYKAQASAAIKGLKCK